MLRGSSFPEAFIVVAAAICGFVAYPTVYRTAVNYDYSSGSHVSDFLRKTFPTALQITCEEAEIDCNYNARYRLVQKLEAQVGPIFTSTAYCWRPEGGCYIGTRHQNLRLINMLSISDNQKILKDRENTSFEG